MIVRIVQALLVVPLIFSCSESTTNHDGSFFGGDNSAAANQATRNQEGDLTPIDPDASGCEIKGNELLADGCAEYSGFARNRLVTDCKNLSGIIKPDCSLYYGKSQCLGSFGGFGGITIYGASPAECDLIKADPMIPEGTEITYIP